MSTCGTLQESSLYTYYAQAKYFILTIITAKVESLYHHTIVIREKINTISVRCIGYLLFFDILPFLLTNGKSPGRNTKRVV